jgi:hypothetical protein
MKMRYGWVSGINAGSPVSLVRDDRSVLANQWRTLTERPLMKRKIMLLGAVAALATVVAGCGSSATSSMYSLGGLRRPRDGRRFE